MSERIFWFFEDCNAREGTLFPLMKDEVDNITKEIYGLNIVGNNTPIKTQDKSKKINIVLSEGLSGWQLTNTVGHISAYLGSIIKDDLLSRQTFSVSDGTEITANSQYPVITLIEKKEKMLNLLSKIKEAHLPYLAYTEDMITYSDDIELSKVFEKKSLQDLEIIGIGFFGENEKVAKVTKNISLWK
jgi:hypothetical protein